MKSSSVYQILRGVLLLLGGLLPITNLVQSEHILFLLTSAGYSHLLAEWPLAENLINRGHKVTVISPHKHRVPNNHPNLTHIIPSQLNKYMEDIFKDNFDVNLRASGLIPKLFMTMDYLGYGTCEATLKSPDIKKWLKTTPKIDLIIADCMQDCSFGLAEKLKSKRFLFQPLPLMTRYFEPYGIPLESSSIPEYDVSYKPPLTFFNRLAVVFLPFVYKIAENYFYPKYVRLFQTELGLENFPSLWEMQEQTSLIMINGDYLGEYARSLPPFVVKVPGLHVKGVKDLSPIDKDIAEFISGERFIYISFGSIANAPHLPISIRNVFFNSIRAFPEIRFIWSWNGEIPDKVPSNLFLKPWTDQQALLAHPNIKGFITQAGKPSFNEAFYNGVPTITFPIFGDQDFNSARAEGLGASILLELIDVTEEDLQKSISRLLNDENLRSRAKDLASLAKDVPMAPIDVAVWWTEFVLRHSAEELSLLKSPTRHLNWFQKRELDIWGFVLIFLFTSAYSTYFICSKIIRKFFGKNVHNQVASQQKPKLN